MPEQGRYEKLPRPESIRALVTYLQSSSAVRAVERESTQLIVVNRVNRPLLRTYMTNTYIVGLADVYEIFSEVDDLDAIVTMSAWNGYTAEAKAFCKEQRVGLFRFKEFLGAVHYVGHRYLDYIPPEEREDNERRTRRG